MNRKVLLNIVLEPLRFFLCILNMFMVHDLNVHFCTRIDEYTKKNSPHGASGLFNKGHNYTWLIRKRPKHSILKTSLEFSISHLRHILTDGHNPWHHMHIIFHKDAYRVSCL